MSDVLDVSTTFVWFFMHLMTYLYSDYSGSWTTEVSLPQRSVAFYSSNSASIEEVGWVVVLACFLAFLTVGLGIMALITLLTISDSSYPASCASSIWCMRLTYISLSFWFASPIWPLIFSFFLNKPVLKFPSRRMGEKLPWLSLSALLSATIAFFFPSSFWSACAVSWYPFYNFKSSIICLNKSNFPSYVFPYSSSFSTSTFMIMYFRSLLPFDVLVCSPSIPGVAANKCSFSTSCLHKNYLTLKNSSSAIIIIFSDCQIGSHRQQ